MTVRVTICAYDKPDNIGGPVSWLRRLAPLLRERGIEVRCLFIMHWGDTGPALSSLLADGFSCKWTGAQLTEDRVRWILDDLRENPPAVFIPNLVVAGYFAARWAREAGIQTVGVLHSDDGFYRAFVAEFVTGAKSQRLNAVVCVSQQLEADVKMLAPQDVGVRRIPYGIAMPETAVTHRDGVLRLAFSGRLAEEQKRISDVTRALLRAIAEVPGTTASIFGGGPDRDHVERLLAENTLGSRVTLEGLVDSERMQQRLLDADVIVLLSDYEGLPISLLEAMACGCVPVCLRGRSGIGELVEHDLTGLIVEDREDAFVRAIARLQTESGLWERLSHGAREKAGRYSSTSAADVWALVLEELAATSRVKSRVPEPRSLRLPPVNPALASADMRRPRHSLASRSRVRTTLGRLRRWAAAIARPRTAG
jgi:glycosyltransferase involved in cell wall biosynthesis